MTDSNFKLCFLIFVINKYFMKKLFFLILALIVLVSGCTSARISKKLASGSIGCQPADITITNETAGIDGIHNFTATCNNKDYICTYMYPNPISCKESQVSNLTPPP